jgi:IS605 OrfB family transposase
MLIFFTMLVRSIPVKLKVEDLIIRTIELYKQGLQLCIDKAWEMKIRNNIKLHPFVYRDLRNLGLPADISIGCIKQACGMVKKAKAKPFIKKVSVNYKPRRTFSFKNNILSLSTIGGRIKLPFKIPDYALRYFNWKIVESLLFIRDNKCFFIFTFTAENPIASNQHCEVLGIDCGINKLAVTSQNKFYGKDFKSKRIKHDRTVSQLQSKCTKSAKKRLKAISGRWRRFMRLKNHEISKKIVDELKSGDVIVMEDLTNIRQKTKYNKWTGKWAFRQLQSFIEYKALTKGIRIAYCNPFQTSKMCNRCNSLNTIRHAGFFECLDCSFHCDCDLQASRNIAKRYIADFCWASITKPHISNDECKAPIFS